MFSCVVLAGLLAAPVFLSAQSSIQAPPAAPAPAADTMAFYKALDLETAGNYSQAAPLFRQALRSSVRVEALLGLERAYAELDRSDSLLPILDTLIAADPREATFRTVQLRTLESVGRDADARRAFERWTQLAPGDATPYREYAGLLLDRNQTAAADSVIQRAGTALGSTKGLSLQIANVRAANGEWVASAQAWRDVLADSPDMEQAAAYALAPAPDSVRAALRGVFTAPPVRVGPRRALASLETTWGSPDAGWLALAGLPPDSVSAAAWEAFGQEAESDERWPLARAAFEAALRVHRTPDLAFHAATAALQAGDPAAALRFAPLSDAGMDSAVAARTYLPLITRAMALSGRAADAERLERAYDHWMTPGTRNQVIQNVAYGWIRLGDVTHAHATLATAGVEGDSSDAAGWLALYQGNLKTARVLLRGGTESTPELALALGLIARIRADSAPMIGHGFLQLARGDSTGAATTFVTAADATPDAASLLLATAAQLRAALHDISQATLLWKRILDTQPASPEAPQAELAWARALRDSGDRAAATTRLEHLILTYPDSALLPQARRDLDQLRGATPGGG